MRAAEPMAKHTSFRIGGPAPMAFPATIEELTELYCFCLENGHQPLILGAGTNVLAPDSGLERLVISTKELSGLLDLGDGMIEAQCGVQLSRLACFARDLGLTGLEFAHGIPGSVGGGIYMNAGAYGGEMKDVITEVSYIDDDGTVKTVEGCDCDFGYRQSIFNKGNKIIISAKLTLNKGNKDDILATMRDLNARRKEKQPLEFPSAGSTFRRPEGYFAGALIESSGLKGTRIGGAEVSTKHAGFIINTGGATSSDVDMLANTIEQEILNKYGIALVREAEFVN